MWPGQFIAFSAHLLAFGLDEEHVLRGNAASARTSPTAPC